MLFKFTEVKTYYIEAYTEEEALDKYSELHEADVTIEVVTSVE